MNFLQLLQQNSSSAPSSSDIPATIQGAIALLLLFAAREVPTLARRAVAYIDTRIEERKKRVDALETANQHIKSLYDRLDKVEDRVTHAENRAIEADKRSDENKRKADDLERQIEGQRELHAREIGSINEKLTAMTQENQSKELALAALTQDNKVLKEEKEAAEARAAQAEQARAEAEQKYEAEHQLRVAAEEALTTLQALHKALDAKLKEYETGNLPTPPPDAPKEM